MIYLRPGRATQELVKEATKTLCEDKYDYNTKQNANGWESKHNKMPSVWQGQNM